jgi:hypothetical protein
MSETTMPMKWAGITYAALLLLTLIAFWPSYISVPMKEYGMWFHLHAVAATLWLLILIVQPITIHSGRRDLHRCIGLASLVLMPILPISILGVAHTAMQGATGPEFDIHAYLFYDSVVLGTIFVASYVMAIINRHNIAVHSRYMVCTGLTLIDPVADRLAERTFYDPEFNYKMFTYGLICLILIVLIWRCAFRPSRFPNNACRFLYWRASANAELLHLERTMGTMEVAVRELRRLTYR